MKARLQLLVLAGLCAALTCSAQVTWTGAVNSDFSTAGNWDFTGTTGLDSGIAPGLAANAGAAVLFGPNLRNSVVLNSSPTLGAVAFSSPNKLYYSFSAPTASTLAVTGLSCVSTSGGKIEFDANISFLLPAAQTWTIGTNDEVTIDGSVTSTGVLTLAGPGTLRLFGDNSVTWTGGLNVVSGTVQAGSSAAFGTGPITIGAAGALAAQSYSGTVLGNAVSIQSGATLGANGYYENQLTLTGVVTAADLATTLHLRPESRTYIDGTFTATNNTTAVSFSGGGAFALLGTTDQTKIGNLTVSGSKLFFGTAAALPAGTIAALSETRDLISYDSYIGMAGGFVGASAAPSADATALVGKLNQAGFAGTLGFDTDRRSYTGGPNEFHVSLDLSGFGSGFRGLGTASDANLASDSTLNFGSGVDYKFGGGGGRLTVLAPLALNSTAGLTLNSPADNPLTLVLGGANTFSGHIVVEHSYLVFGTNGAFPAASGQLIKLGNSAYVSATESSPYTAADLLARIQLTNTDPTLLPILGFDSSGPASSARTVSDTIDLSTLPGLYLGTMTFGPQLSPSGLTLTGQIIVAANQPLRLAGVNGGRLNIAPLLGTGTPNPSVTKLEIGHPDDEIGTRGTVVLNGANTYAGGTTLRNGTLELAGSSVGTWNAGTSSWDIASGPIGTGKLIVNTGTISASPAVASLLPKDGTVVDLMNEIFLEADAYLMLGRSSLTTGSELILRGAITGSGTLQFEGSPTTSTTLYGASARTGSTYVYNTVVNVANSDALKSDFLFLSGATLNFTAAATAPTLGTLGSSEIPSVLNFAAANSTLTINQAMGHKFNGSLSGTGLSLIKAGCADLWFGSSNTIGGKLTINDGRVGIGGPTTLSTGSTWIQGPRPAAPEFTAGVVVDAGATWTNTNETKIGYTGYGSVEVRNGSSVSTDALYIGYDGTGSLNISSGGHLTAGNISIANSSTSSGEAVVSGSASSLQATNIDVSTISGGTGVLRVDGGSSLTVTDKIQLLSSSARLSIAEGGGNVTATNGIVNNGWIEFGNTGAVTFTPAISGAGQINKWNSGALTLSGDNRNFAGSIEVSEGSITFLGDNSAGSGWLSLGSIESAPVHATFASTTPAMGSLSGDNSESTLTLQNSATLTINQSYDGGFAGIIAGTGTGTGAALIVQGPASLELRGANTYSGGTTVTGGAMLIAASGSALGSASVTVNAASVLAVAPNTSISNSIILNSGSTIAGSGTFASSVTVGSGVTLKPEADGINTVGTLTFNSLTLNGGGSYDWNVADASSYDRVVIAMPTTLTFEAGGSTPFRFRLVPLCSPGVVGAASGLTAGQSYSFPLIESATIVNFATFNYTIDDSAFSSAMNSVGQWTFSLEQSGTSILLNFTPVPEPSTWALLITGLAIVGVGALRQRQRR